MSLTDWACLGIFLVGFVLFVVGANVYNAVVGYAGLYMGVGAIIAYLLIYVYKELTKKPTAPAPAPPIQNP